MVAKKAEILDRLANLQVAKSGSRRYPHKPLLVLLAIKYALEGDFAIDFPVVQSKLNRLLDVFAPPAVRHNASNPYWRLVQDEIWVVEGLASEYYKSSNPPGVKILKSSSGAFTKEILDLLLSDSSFCEEAIDVVLQSYFPQSIHEDIVGAIGLEFRPSEVADAMPEPSRLRDPYFRTRVLAAYDYRCAVTGFQAALGGTYFGCEAAHIKWHAYDGPDVVENGLSLEPTMHKLFDVGAWSLTDDRRVLVSADFTGSDYALDRLRGLHGKSIAIPAPGNPLVDIKYIRWHRDGDRGGIFRAPGLPL